MSITITETNFMKINNCPRQAYLIENTDLSPELSRREIAGVSRRMWEARREILKKFPAGVRINGDTLKSAHRTAECVRRGEKVIYGAVFMTGKAMCRCDVIILNNGAYDIYVVKPSDKFNRWIDEAIYDKVVMEMCNVKAGNAYVTMIDRESGMLGMMHVGEESEKKKRTLREKIDLAIKNSEAKKEPAPQLEKRCSACKYFPWCFKTDESSIFSLKELSFLRAMELYKKGIRTVPELLDAGVTDGNVLREIKIRESDDDFYNKAAISEFLAGLSYPLGFLDFETMEVREPNDEVLSPLDTVVTQFSYHLIEEEGGEVKHYDFIGDGVSYPEREAAKKLVSVVKPEHCVLMYSVYEKVCIKRMMKRLPEYGSQLEKISERLVDLEVPFAKKYLVNRRMQGRSGLKTVLPALYPGDKRLDYHYMNIQNGKQAESVYSRLSKMNDEERERAKKDLRDYCALDTLAMIKLLEKLYYYGRGEE